MLNNTLIFRTDATSDIGIGHTMRCISLADYWKKQKGEVIFVGYFDSNELRKRICEAGFDYMFLQKPDRHDLSWLEDLSNRNLPAAHFYGVDRDETNFTWVVVDGYHFSEKFLRQIKSAGYKVLCLDDTIHLTEYSADIIVNQSVGVNVIDYHCPPNTVILTGSKYRIINSCFFKREKEKSKDNIVIKILVSFGGADSRNVTLSVIKALDGLEKRNLEVKVVAGPTNLHVESLKRELKKVRYANELLQNVDIMASLMTSSDIAISAGGGTSWEIAATGLPSILIPVAENQIANVQELSSAGVALTIGGIDSIGSDRFKEKINLLIDYPEIRKKMALKGFMCIDGKGPDRIISKIRFLSETEKYKGLKIRRAEIDDSQQLFRMANDFEVRKHSFSTEQIKYEDHFKWFKEKLNSKNKTAIWVMEFEGIIVAQVRYDTSKKRTAIIDFSVNAAFRGNGYGTQILKKTINKACDQLLVSRLKGIALDTNQKSSYCFIHSGFTMKEKKVVNGYSCNVYEFVS